MVGGAKNKKYGREASRPNKIQTPDEYSPSGA